MEMGGGGGWQVKLERDFTVKKVAACLCALEFEL